MKKLILLFLGIGFSSLFAQNVFLNYDNQDANFEGIISYPVGPYSYIAYGSVLEESNKLLLSFLDQSGQELTSHTFNTYNTSSQPDLGIKFIKVDDYDANILYGISSTQDTQQGSTGDDMFFKYNVSTNTFSFFEIDVAGQNIVNNMHQIDVDELLYATSESKSNFPKNINVRATNISGSILAHSEDQNANAFGPGDFICSKTILGDNQNNLYGIINSTDETSFFDADLITGGFSSHVRYDNLFTNYKSMDFVKESNGFTVLATDITGFNLEFFKTDLSGIPLNLPSSANNSIVISVPDAKLTARKIFKTSDGGYLCLAAVDGYNQMSQYFPDRILILKLNVNGIVEFVKTLEFPGSFGSTAESLAFVDAIVDGNDLVVLGRRNQNPLNLGNASVFIKIDLSDFTGTSWDLCNLVDQTSTSSENVIFTTSLSLNYSNYTYLDSMLSDSSGYVDIPYTLDCQVDPCTDLSLQTSTWIDITCENLNGGSIQVNANGGALPGNQGPISYELTVEDGNGNIIVGNPAVTITNSAPYFINNLPAGTYIISIVSEAGCTGSRTRELESPNCCWAAASDEFVNFTNIYGQYVTGTSVGNDILVLNGKYYVDDYINFENITVDATNCDLVFADCAGFSFDEGSTLRANNSVFRPCLSNGTWIGLSFFDGANHQINESTFKNARTANVFYDMTDGRIQNNLYQNCNVGVGIPGNESFQYPIAGNSFIFDEDMPDYTNLAVQCEYPHFGAAMGIVVTSSYVTGEIAQNTFVNNRVKEAIGISVSASSKGAKISENTFTDFTHAISFDDLQIINGDYEPGATTKEGQFLIENNEIEVSRTYADGSSQIQVTNSSAEVAIIGNEIRSSFNSLVAKGGAIGIEVAGADNVEIVDNQINGPFSVGVYIFKANNIHCISNQINDSFYAGLVMGSSAKVWMKCNVIDKRDVQFGNGIVILDECRDTYIFSNCIFNTYTAINLSSTNTFGEDGSTIDIRDNYLYNYDGNGVLSTNYNNVKLGTSNANPGQNTFWSNSLNALDIDANGAGLITAFNNFGINQINLNNPVYILSSDEVYSTAACGHQIYDEQNPQGNLREEFTCVASISNWIDKWDNTEKRAEIQSTENDFDKYQLALEALLALIKEDSDVAANWHSQVVANGILNDYYTKLFNFEYAWYTNQLVDALEILIQYQFSETDNYQLFAKKLLIQNELGQLDIANLTESDLNQLREIASVEDSKTNTARSILLNYYQESKLYVNKFDMDEVIPESGSGISITDETQLWLAPNPVSDQLTIELSLVDISDADLQVYNAMGQIVLNQKLNFVAGQTKLDVNQLASGVYIVSIKHGKDFVKQAKFVKQ